MWKASSTKALTRRAQLKYIDAGRMEGGHERQVRSRINQKSTNLATSGRVASNIEEFGRVVENENSQSKLTNGVKLKILGKVAKEEIARASWLMETKLEWLEKSNNSGINLKGRPHEDQEEGLCKLMINGVARHHRERETRTAGDG